MAACKSVTVRMFGMLDGLRRERGWPLSLEVQVPEDGISAAEIATSLGLPLERIEGVFRNHVIRSLDECVRPGDKIAFVPHGTPGPHRYFLGLYDAGRERGGDGD